MRKEAAPLGCLVLIELQAEIELTDCFIVARRASTMTGQSHAPRAPCVPSPAQRSKSFADFPGAVPLVRRRRGGHCVRPAFVAGAFALFGAAGVTANEPNARSRMPL